TTSPSPTPSGRLRYTGRRTVVPAPTFFLACRSTRLPWLDSDPAPPLDRIPLSTRFGTRERVCRRSKRRFFLQTLWRSSHATAVGGLTFGWRQSRIEGFDRTGNDPHQNP